MLENWIAPRLRRLAEAVAALTFLISGLMLVSAIIIVATDGIGLAFFVTLSAAVVALIAAFVDLGVIYLLLHMDQQQTSLLETLKSQG